MAIITAIKRLIGRARAKLTLPGYVIPLAVLVAVLFAYFVSDYYFLGDDCFISLRYARNLVEGHGLVYNPGERVEGYTNFLWVVMLAGFMFVGLPPEPICAALGIASGILILFAIIYFGARRRGATDPLIWIAPLCLAGNRTFCAWSTGGLATQFFSLLALLGVLCFVGERERQVRWPWASALLLAAATLTRPEGALFFTVALCFFVVDAVILRRRRLLTVAPWLVVYVLIVGTHVGWRYGYYGYLLPNTFYAKVSGFWWDQSRIWLWAFASKSNLVWICPLLVILFVLKRDFVSILFATLVASYLGYLVYIGGDHHEFRLATPILPYLYWLFQEGAWAVQDWCTARSRSTRTSLPAGMIVGAVLVGATVLSNGNRLSLEFQKGTGIASVEGSRSYASRRIEEGKFLRSLVIDGLLSGKELLAVVGAGALPYYSRLPTLDLCGLNDLAVGHQEITRRGVIAHEKRASHEYLVRRGVVIYETTQGIVQPRQIPGGPGPMLHRTVTTPYYQGPLRCVKAKGRYLLFATTLSDAQFRKTFSRCEIVF
ncbi:MAG: hypothetical protein JXQ73_20100 [Phycisphaerae bacterium]|nr:hypothetical protein [Phycisphaerae bacterium]